MKIMQINGVIHSGSTGKIVDDIKDFLIDSGHQVTICYGIGKKTEDGYKFCYRYEQAIYRRVSQIIGLRYGFAPFSTMRLIKKIEQEKPDIVHLHSINGNCVNIMKLLTYLKVNNYPTVITNHAEFFYTGNCTSTYGCNQYINGCINCPRTGWATDNAFVKNTKKAWDRMKEAFKWYNNLYMVSVSPYIMERAQLSPFVKQAFHRVIMNGVDTKVFHFTNKGNIRERLKIDGETKIALFVTSSFSLEPNHLKGGYYLVKLAAQMEKENIHFLIVGNEKAEQTGLPDNMTFLGKITNKEELAMLYSESDVTLILSRMETFGMTCAESLCCGTPVVGFKCGGPENIALREYSLFVPYADLQLLQKNIFLILNKCKGKKNEISIKAQTEYCVEKISKLYFELYKEIMD